MINSEVTKYEELRHELFDKTTVIEEVLSKLKKATTILSQWEEEYSFSENPDPRAAIEYSGNLTNDKHKRGQQSHTWIFEYDRIWTLVSIASDYVSESKRILEKETGSKPVEVCHE
jgi:hypothetical protein